MGDSVLTLFSNELKRVFSKKNAMFVYNENSHFVIVLEKTDLITVEDILNNFAVSLDGRETCENVGIKYTMGVAETFRDRIQSARALLVEAIKNSRDYESAAKGTK